MKYHVGVTIFVALDELKKGNNIFTGSPTEVMKDLLAAQSTGRSIYTGCDNTDSRGTCLGHEDGK